MPGDDFGQADALEGWEQVVSLFQVKHLILSALPLTVAKLWIVSFILDWMHRILSLLKDPPVEGSLALYFLDFSIFGGCNAKGRGVLLLDEALAKECFHLSVVVQRVSLEVNLLLNRADQHLVGYCVQHVQQLPLLHLDHLTCDEQLDLRLHLDVEEDLASSRK